MSTTPNQHPDHIVVASSADGINPEGVEIMLAQARQHPGWQWLWDRLMRPLPEDVVDEEAIEPTPVPVLADAA